LPKATTGTSAETTGRASEATLTSMLTPLTTAAGEWLERVGSAISFHANVNSAANTSLAT
jgi:hypothetical protein